MPQAIDALGHIAFFLGLGLVLLVAVSLVLIPFEGRRRRNQDKPTSALAKRLTPPKVMHPPRDI